MNLNKWIKIGGIFAVLLGASPMLAVAQEYGGNQFEERHLIDVRNSYYHCHRQSYRDSRGHSYNRRYPQYDNRYHRNNHSGYQSR